MEKMEREKRNHYQGKGRFKLPRETYRMTYYAIRRTYREVLPYINIDNPNILCSYEKRETENIAVNRVSDQMFIEACEDAWKAIPEVYRKNVYDHIVNETKYIYINFVSVQTMKEYVKQYIFFVAINLGWV